VNSPSGGAVSEGMKDDIDDLREIIKFYSPILSSDGK
jgi:hypothetical protein